MFKMSPHDAELFYDGKIPPGVIDHTLPSYFMPRPETHGRIGKVTPKPEAIRARMRRVINDLAGNGAFTESDLERFGFSKADITAYAKDELRAVMVANPTLLTLVS